MRSAKASDQNIAAAAPLHPVDYVRRRPAFLDTPRYDRGRLKPGHRILLARDPDPAQFDDEFVASRTTSPRLPSSAIFISSVTLPGLRARPDYGRPSDRSHYAAGDQRRAADHRRGNGTRALSHVLLFDHSGMSQDLGAGLFDTAVQHAVRVGIDAAAYRLAARLSRRHPGDLAGRRMARGRSRHPQSPLSRLEPFAGHRRRGAGLP